MKRQPSGPDVAAPALRDCVKQTFILAWREDTTALECALRQEGFVAEVLRPHYSAQEMTFSRMTRCLMNHRSAWRACARREGLSMVLEADFVPCVGLGAMPPPFPWETREKAWGWLYAGGPRLYEVWPGGYLRGHAACPVATVMSPTVAGVLLDFAEAELAHNDPQAYFPWDTYVQYHGKRHGVMSFIPFRQYGEHGGVPNPEHASGGMSMSGAHQAEALRGPLHFLPAYARGSRWRYRQVRLHAKLRGFGRLVSGRFVEPKTLRSYGFTRAGARLLAIGFGRLLTPY
jgi:hypothetical protein